MVGSGDGTITLSGFFVLRSRRRLVFHALRRPAAQIGLVILAVGYAAFRRGLESHVENTHDVLQRDAPGKSSGRGSVVHPGDTKLTEGNEQDG